MYTIVSIAAALILALTILSGTAGAQSGDEKYVIIGTTSLTSGSNNRLFSLNVGTASSSHDNIYALGKVLVQYQEFAPKPCRRLLGDPIAPMPSVG